MHTCASAHRMRLALVLLLLALVAVPASATTVDTAVGRGTLGCGTTMTLPVPSVRCSAWSQTVDGTNATARDCAVTQRDPPGPRTFGAACTDVRVRSHGVQTRVERCGGSAAPGTVFEEVSFACASAEGPMVPNVPQVYSPGCLAYAWTFAGTSTGQVHCRVWGPASMDCDASFNSTLTNMRGDPWSCGVTAGAQGVRAHGPRTAATPVCVEVRGRADPCAG